MEMVKNLGYSDILSMPYSTFMNLLKWKSELEKDRQKEMNERVQNMKNTRNRKQGSDKIKIKRKR